VGAVNLTFVCQLLWTCGDQWLRLKLWVEGVEVKTGTHVKWLRWVTLAQLLAAGLRWLKQKVQLAIQLSQEESDDLRQRQEHSHELLDGCHLQGLKRVPVPPLGNCLLESVVHAALAAPLSPMQLRHAVVDYLRQLGRMFGPRMGRPFFWSIPRVLRPHGT